MLEQMLFWVGTQKLYGACRDVAQHPLLKGRCVAGVKAVAAAVVTAALVPLAEASHLILGHRDSVQVQCLTVQDTTVSCCKRHTSKSLVQQDVTKAFALQADNWMHR